MANTIGKGIVDVGIVDQWFVLEVLTIDLNGYLIAGTMRGLFRTALPTGAPEERLASLPR